jgi:septal ring factor EnvC (AmiA/AmiB activator)
MTGIDKERESMARATAIAVVLVLTALCRPGTVLAPITAAAQSSQVQSSQASPPATAEDVAKLRQSLAELRAQLAALNRRLNAIEEQLNSIQK